jgi:hypothetical protein
MFGLWNQVDNINIAIAVPIRANGAKTGNFDDAYVRWWHRV